ncbi:MAG TPA: DNA repair protein RecO [Candidatus Saccharimonadales bacterium]|nr:DNA repair protein RecO [Candidatus Saccharimonadales bacterium]
MRSVRTPAIVLRRTNYGEADRILQLLTPDGKQSVMAKGVRCEKSRLAGGIELFAICEVVIGEGRGDLGILTSSKLVHFFRHIMDDYDRMQFAYTAIKLVAKSSEMVEGPEWYDVLAETLAGLDSHLVAFELVQIWFYLHYAAVMGYELSLWHDENGKELSPGLSYRYDVAEKGLKPIQNGEITANHIKLLRLIATRPLKVLAKIGGTEAILVDCLLVSREHAAI